MNLQINYTSDVIIIISIISIFAIYISFKHHFFAKKISILIILRSLVILLLILLLYNPILEKKNNNKKSLPWHIYIDKSLSIKYHRQPSVVAYRKGIEEFLKKITDKNITFEVFSFGARIDTLDQISALNLNSNSTNMGLIFDKINNDYQKNLGGVIIFTDGQINQGPPVQEFYDSYSEIPIFTVGIGDTIPMLDVFIRSIDSSPLTVKGQNINIDVVISSLGNINERVNVNLFDEKNKLIGSKLIKINGQEENELIRFQIKADKIGENNFFVKCSALSDEINIQNNQQKIKIHVMKDQYNVALVTGAPSYNTRLIKGYLEEQGNNFIDHYVMNSKNFNQKLKDFMEKKYEVIIFDNNPTPSKYQKWESVERVFAKKIISHNSSFFVIPGPELDIVSLNKYFTILDLEAKIIDKPFKIATDWAFLDAWSNFNTISSYDKSYDGLVAYPPQTPAFQLKHKSGSGSEGSYANYINSEFKNPILVLGEKQQIRYAIWNSIDLASLKYMLSNSDINYLFEDSMMKITNWLLKKSDSREFVFRTDKNSYQHGELILLKGVSSDLNDNLNVKDGVVELYHDDQYISSKPLHYDLNDKTYKSKFWASKPGDINYIIKFNKGVNSYEVYNGSFKVQESHIELNKIYINEDKLDALSNSSGGFFKKWEDRDEVIFALNDVEKVESYVSTFIFRYNYYYVCLIILMLSFEWFYRRKNGMI